MPKVCGFTDSQKIENQRISMSAKVDHLRLDHNLSYKKIAETLGITEQAVSQQFRNRNITLKVILAVFYLTGAEPEEIGKIMKVRG